MKKNSLNKVYDVQNRSISYLKLFSVSAKKTILIVLFSFSFINLFAQTEKNSTPRIMEVNAYISSLKEIERNSPTSFSNAKNVEDLVFNLQPSTYFSSGVVQTFGDSPKDLYTDISSLNRLSTANIPKSNIEIVIITITNSNDLNSKIDLSVFSEYHKLKYIYIVSNETSTQQNIAKMLLNYDEQYSIFYKIEKGE